MDDTTEQPNTEAVAGPSIANNPLISQEDLPGEIRLGGLPRPRRILGCGPLNLPYDDNGNLNLPDIISGTFSDGRWSYEPIGKGMFIDDRVEREDVGAYEYEAGDVLYEENGRSYIASRVEEQLSQKGRFLGLDSWRYFADSLPARLMGQKNSVSFLPKQHEATASNLCSECTNIKLETTLSSLHKPNSICDLCAILSKCPKEKHPELRLVDARAYLRICSIPDHSKAIDDTSATNLLPSFPTFFESCSKEHFFLINEWLRLCDEGNCGHPSGCAPGSCPDVKPARVLHISPEPISPNIVHLLTTNELDEMGPYIALSHCWGSQSAGIPSWCTTPANEKERRTQGITVESLPANFQDAIRVTRELGKEYLWVDSLCILQGDQDDWRAEGRKMAGVFRNAYCVIAASSARSSTEGFLDRPASKSPVQYVTVPESSHGPVFITSATDDFVGDVEQGQLNTRAWVLQEHVLARRTIHFTDRQTYWECGGGIRCETLTYMRNEGRSSLFSDPNFPASLMGRATIAKVTIFLSFFEKYSQLGITVNTDRPIAIDALARELAGGLDTNFRSGVFDNFLHRCILWHQLGQPLERILFEPEFKMPSWSWMAYSGPIKYADINMKFEWDDAVRLKGSDTLEARLVQLQLEEQNCQIHLSNLGHHDIKYANQDGSVGQLWFDDLKWEASSHMTAAIIGREQQPDELQRNWGI
ncbi:hypothetical protein ACHAQJ_000445 [Trichoderma viride]